MDHIRTILPKIVRKRGLHEHADAALVVHHARQWIATEMPGLRHQLSVTQFKDGILTIEAHNSIAAQECHMRLQALQEHLLEDQKHGTLCGVRILRSNGEKRGQSLASPH